MLHAMVQHRVVRVTYFVQHVQPLFQCKTMKQLMNTEGCTSRQAHAPGLPLCRRMPACRKSTAHAFLNR